MKKIKNEGKLLKMAIELGLNFAKKEKYSVDPHLSDKDKAEAVYNMLVTYKQITPLPADKVDGPNMKHRLVMWILNMLPDNHPLVQ